MKTMNNYLRTIFVLIICMASLTINAERPTRRIVTVKPKSFVSNYINNLHIIRSNLLGYYDVLIPDEINTDDYITELQNSEQFEYISLSYVGTITDIPSSISIDGEINNVLQNGVINESNILNMPVRDLSFPNDQYFSAQSYYNYINIAGAWNITTGHRHNDG